MAVTWFPRRAACPHLVAQAETDDAVEVVVWRDGKRESLRLVVGLPPGAEGLASAPEAGESDEAEQPSLGLELAPLTPNIRARYELAESVEGAIVVRVDADGTAAEKGLRPGDIIVRAGNRPVASPADVSEALARVTESGGDVLLLLVERQGARQFIAVPIG